MDEFQDLLIQFGKVLKAENFDRSLFLLAGLSGPIRKSLKWEWEDFSVRGMAHYPILGHERGNLRSARLPLIKWLKRGRWKKCVCAVIVDLISEHVYIIENLRQSSALFAVNLVEKIWPFVISFCDSCHVSQSVLGHALL